MSSLTNQTAINGLKDFFARSHKNISSLSQVVPNPLPYGEQFTIETQPAGGNTAGIFGFADALFIQNPTGTYFTPPGSGIGQVVINHNATETNNLPSLYVSSITQLDSKLILANTNPNENTAMLIGNTNAAGQQAGYYQLYNGNGVGGGGIQPSTLQLFSYFGGGINQNIQFLPNGQTYVPNGSLNTAAINNLQVSTINGGQPFSGSNQVIMLTSQYQNNNNAARFFDPKNALPNSYYECMMSGRVSWSNAPGANDYINIGFYGGSAQLTDQVNYSIYPASAGTNTFIDFAVSGTLQTSASTSNIEGVYQVATSATPLNYTFSIYNGVVKFRSPQ